MEKLSETEKVVQLEYFLGTVWGKSEEEKKIIEF